MSDDRKKLSSVTILEPRDSDKSSVELLRRLLLLEARLNALITATDSSVRTLHLLAQMANQHVEWFKKTDLHFDAVETSMILESHETRKLIEALITQLQQKETNNGESA